MDDDNDNDNDNEIKNSADNDNIEKEIDNLIIEISKQDYNEFYLNIFNKTEDYIKRRGLILTDTRALQLQLQSRQKKDNKYNTDYYVCYTDKGMFDIGQLIKLYKSMNYENIQTNSYTLSNIKGSELVECIISVQLGNLNAKIIKLITIPMNIYKEIEKDKIDGFNIISKKLARILIYDNLTNFLLKAEDLKKWMNFKINIETDTPNENKKEKTNESKKEKTNVSKKEKTNVSKKENENKKEKTNVSKKEKTNGSKKENENKIKIFNYLFRLNNIIFVGDMVLNIFKQFANKKGEKDILELPIIIISPYSKNVTKDLKNKMELVWKGEVVKYQYHHSMADLINNYYTIEIGNNRKIMAIIFDSIGLCVPYRSIMINGDRRNKFNIEIPEVKRKNINNGKKNNDPNTNITTKIKIGDFYVVVKIYLWLNYIFGNSYKKINDLFEFRKQYFYINKNIITSPFSVLNFKCYNYNEKTIYTNDAIRPKILLWKIKKNDPDKYKKIKRECKVATLN